MAETTDRGTALLVEVPEAKRGRIVSGMRWTVWLSAISVPFSYGITILLARTSPEAIGTYGLLGVYIGVVLGLFYLGGDAVAIKYIPELDEAKRLSFLASYFVVICLTTLPWLAAAGIWADKLHYLLGQQASPRLELLILFLSPITIVSSLIGAALKGMLEIRWAQAIARLITIGSFLVYAAFFVLSPASLAHSYTAIIWVTYLGLSLLSIVLGFWRLWHSIGAKWQALHFYLPRGFWSYTLSLQQLSALGFFTQRLDVILVLNSANLAVLGQYVAVVTLAESIRLISRFFIDTLLPSLTNMMAEHDLAAASDVFSMHMRILLLVNTATTCGLILFARPATALLGQKYIGLTPTVAVLALFVGLSTPGGVGGTVLSSIGKQQRAVWIAVGQTALYLGLFAGLWPRFQLLGAVMAYGIAWVISNLALLITARLSSPFKLAATRDYVVFGVIAVLAAAAARLDHFDFAGALVVWTAATTLFLVFAKYSFGECRKLIHFFLPIRLIS